MIGDRAPAPSLGKAVSDYRAEREDELNQQSLGLLTRLASSPHAAGAFKRLKLPDGRAEAHVLTACIEADKVVRTFPRLIKKQKNLLDLATRWDKAVAELRKFTDEISGQRDPPRIELAGLDDLWSLKIFEPPSDSAALTEALDLIASSIEWRRGIADANLAHIGATRDTQIRQAAENAAIWILTAGVYDAARKPPLPGKPHVKEVADLAEVVLGIDVTDFRVRELGRKRRQLYLKMVGNETKRWHREIATRARRRDASDKAVRSPPQKKGAECTNENLNLEGIWSVSRKAGTSMQGDQHGP